MTPAVVAVVVLVAVAVLSPGWRVARGWVTLAHELGHAVVAVLAEGRVRSIRVRWDNSGLTEWTGAPDRRVARGIVAWWGYPAPGALALAVAAGVATGHAVVATAAVAVVMAVVLAVWVRSAWGAAMALSLGLVAGASSVAGEDAATVAGTAIVAVWGVGGVRAALAAGTRARRGDGSDQATLAEVLWLPVAFWAVTMVVVAAASAFAAVALVVTSLDL